jgi:serine/threonine-protein kinase
MEASSPSPDDSGVVALGSVLDGRYRVDAVLGTGGMGRVYRGEHTGIGRPVAIKVLHASLGRNREAAARFQREALASGRLDHPNIVGVSDFGVLDDGCLYLVMEALEGEPVGKRLEREKRIPWPEALEIVRGVLAGLRHAHDRGVVHRDIKPDNIFLARKDGEQIVKILDFGIAKLYAGTGDDPATTRAGLTVGTPAYLSPEQAIGGESKPASDLYSTSVVLFEMLTGRAPYEDTDPLAMLTAHVSREPPWFAEVAPDLQLPPGLEEVVRHGLAKVQAERIGSAIEYQARLDDVLRAAGYAVPGARASGPMVIPGGSRVIASPVPGSLMTPGAFATPMMTTPGPNTAATPMPFANTSLLASAPTPAPGAYPVGAVGTVAEGGAPIPRRWLTIAAAVLVIAAVAGIGLYVGHRGRKSGAEAVLVPIPTAAGLGVDRETILKAALHDLATGRTCDDRRQAIPKLVELGDDRAIPALKHARYRMRGGVIGIGDHNENACLKAEAEAAIEKLGGKVR